MIVQGDAIAKQSFAVDAALLVRARSLADFEHRA
jgi:hypothetical protein